jgi:CMP-N-acetylneuraminic acid synthetase
MNLLFFVPARSNSCGLKGKNYKKINNIPLIGYTLNFLKKLKIKNVLISTDSKKIREICNNLGYKTEYIRPKKVSGSKTKIIDTVLHGVEWYNRRHYNNVSDIVLLQPTSPIRSIQEIKKAISYYKKKKIHSLASVSKIRINPNSLVELKKNNKFKWNFFFKKSFKNDFRQESRDNLYKIDGGLYISSIKFLKKYKKFTVPSKTYLFNSNIKFSVDIDDISDFNFAKLLINNNYA